VRVSALPLLALSLALMSGLGHAATLTITPTTTLAAETGNNTSGAATFLGQTNGNRGVGNVSKVATSTLLYSGSTSKIFAHFMPWFGDPKHMNVGYNSNDPAQVHRQVTDMLSRGISGAIVDWYGPGLTLEDQTVQYMRNEAQNSGGLFSFAVMEDKGALSACAYTTGCNLTQQLIADLTYAYNTYETSPAYLRVSGRPVVFTFAIDAYALDWNAVVAAVPGNPILIFLSQSANGFTHPYSGGAFSWINLNLSNPNDIGLTYLDNFYTTGQAYPAELAIGAGYKGFNDALASWAPVPPRVMNQNCGQTWMSSMAEAGKFYSAGGKQLPFMQLVTWNDYEEGSEIETGIDNCVSVAASVNAGALNWSITGSETTLDHYTVFVSTDGVNLMSLGDVPAGKHNFDLSTLGLATGSYKLYVKAVGKPSMTNHMSAAVPFVVAATALPPVASLSVTPSSGVAPVVVSASTANSSSPDGTAITSSVNFGDGSAPVAATSASHTYTAAGTYTITATVSSATGLSSTATSTVTVSAISSSGSCAASSPGVTVCSPSSGSQTTSPVTISAAAAASSPITSIAVYVDNVLATSVRSANVNAPVAMSAGSHYVVVQAWDSNGAVYKTPINVTVASMKPQTGWWWDPSLTGIGFFLEDGGSSGNGMFAGGFLYDAGGNPTWVVSTGQMNGTVYNGSWLKVTGGQTLLGPYKPVATPTAIANVAINFADSTHGVMTRPDGTTINLQRFPFTSSPTLAPPVAGAPQTGWWWNDPAFAANNPGHGGTGYAIEIQGSNVFIVAYVYDDAGNPVWYLATGALTSPTTYSGNWELYTGGPQLTSPEGSYSSHDAGTASPMSLSFSDATHGTLTMGSVTIPITRMQSF
jgi:PKD repeat protein